jgi:hypothetical protein
VSSWETGVRLAIERGKAEKALLVAAEAVIEAWHRDDFHGRSEELTALEQAIVRRRASVVGR